MELGTFGAILRFATQLEGRAAAFYECAAPAGQEELWGELARGSRQRERRLQDARRELVSEMILESITGLDDQTYQVEPGSGEGEADAMRQAVSLEETAARFYPDAAAKMPIREVARLFQRLARESEQRLARLAG